MKDDFWREVPGTHVEKGRHLKESARTERGVRLYSTASAETHGRTNARWSLQIRSPLRLANGTDSKDYMIATASLSHEDLTLLRDMCTTALRQINATRKP